MTKLFKAVLLLSLQAFTANSYGYIHIEPFIGARMGSNEEFYMISNPAAGNPKPSIGGYYERSGSYIGSKMGIKITPTLVFGGDFRMGKLESTALWGDSAFNDTMTYDTSAIGVFLKYTMAPSVNIWGTYYFKNTHEMTSVAVDSQQNDDYGLNSGTTFEGKKYIIGIGYELLSFLNINLEYSVSKFDTVAYPNLTTFPLPGTTLNIGESHPAITAAELEEFKGSELVLSISFPFEIEI